MTSITERAGAVIGDLITPLVLPVVERNLVPDFVLRIGIKQQLAGELAKVKKLSPMEIAEITRTFIKELKTMPIAINMDKANEQHYEVPEEFYHLVLGPFLKYSSGYWPSPNTTLAESEVAMLELYCERAKIEDGMNVIDLGCGWGSVTLYMASKYPNCKITSISNSNSQREYIMNTAKSRGHKNVNVFTGDISSFDLPKEYYGTADRIISIEMFEHMKNYQLLLKKISNWMKSGGYLFVHIFTARECPGHFQKGWMTDTFFTGGTLPSDQLLLHFQDHVKIDDHWIVSGLHYQRTLEAWLIEIDKKKSEVLPVLEKAYDGKDQAIKWYVNWRLFFIACAEFFGIAKGEEYFISHYRFVKP